MSDPVYKRILIKISGEALAGDKKTGFDFDFISKVCDTVNKCTAMGVEVGIVVGGGNFWRGVKDGAGHVERVSADRMGMLATAMNCLAFADVLRQCGGEAKVLTAVDIQGVGERYSTDKAIEYLKSGKVVMFGCGTGCPFFSTDTAAALRAAEIEADVIFKATNVDGVYDKDPNKYPDAVKYDTLTHSQVLSKGLKVMDSTAASLCRDNSISILVFNLEDPENIIRALNGENIGTLVKE